MSPKLKECSRPNCHNPEWRIDGYCSLYCRDICDIEKETIEERDRIWCKALTQVCDVDTIQRITGRFMLLRPEGEGPALAPNEICLGPPTTTAITVDDAQNLSHAPECCPGCLGQE